MFSVASKGTQGELELSHCQGALGKACKRTPRVLGQRFGRMKAERRLCLPTV